ncbi:MAG: hypothetical protein WCB99_06175 [Candidatus Cybelea sp.]
MGVTARRAAFAAIVTLALSGCGLSSSPAEGLQFQAPSGWKSSPGIMGLMQFWQLPTNDEEVLMLLRSPRPLQPKDVFSSNGMAGTLKNVKVSELRAIQICRNQPATYLAARGTSSRGAQDDAEVVLTNLGGKAYVALYVRPLGAPANPAASAAIRELCAKP